MVRLSHNSKIIFANISIIYFKNQQILFLLILLNIVKYIKFMICEFYLSYETAPFFLF